MVKGYIPGEPETAVRLGIKFWFADINMAINMNDLIFGCVFYQFLPSDQILRYHSVVLTAFVEFTGHNVRFTILKSVTFIPFLMFHSWRDHLLGVSCCRDAFKAFERIKYTREIIMTTLSRIMPIVWSVIWSHDSQDQKSKKDPSEGVTFSNQVASSVILCNRVSPSPEVLIQVQQVVLAVADTPPCSHNKFGQRV